MSVTAQEGREAMRELTRTRPTETLVSAFLLTDALLDAMRLGTPLPHADEFSAIYETRGAIIDVLAERGDAHRIGV